MGKLDDAVVVYGKEFDKLGVKYDAKLLRAVAKGCGPSIYKADASKVSSADKAELERVRKNFLIGKLGCRDTPKLDEAIKEVIDTFGSRNRNKYRAMFYYLLVKKFRKSSMYK